MKELSYYPVTHAHLKPVVNLSLNTEVTGRSAVRYLRFLRKVRVETLELGRICARTIPSIPAHPAHITVAVQDEPHSQWQTVAEVDLPPDPRIEGQGLSQDMPFEEIEAFFKNVMTGEPWKISLGGLETDHLRVECDREHPVWPAHGEYNGGPWNVPFCTLNPLKVYGEFLEEKTYPPLYAPLLTLDKLAPKAPSGMKVIDMPNMLLFQSRTLSIGFSLRRPMIMHLGWDALGEKAGNNRLLCLIDYIRGTGLSGPCLRTLRYDGYPQCWTGHVSVIGNKVVYSNLRITPELVIHAAFTVESDRIMMELEQTCTGNFPVLEAEAWRLNWDLKSGITGTPAQPSLRPGRSGDVAFPVLWATDGVGCLECRLLEGNPNTARLQVESYRTSSCVSEGFLLSDPGYGHELMMLHEGTHRAVYEIKVTNVEPVKNGAIPSKRIPAKVTKAIARHWASTLACFRPEFRGFSNHSASTNCHVIQHIPIDIASFTAPTQTGIQPIDLARYTIETALLDGGGYGYCRNLYLDSDPSLISSAGRIHQVAPDLKWLRKINPGLEAAVKRILSRIHKDGLVVCQDLSGNSGTHRWSTNAMDVVGFGHIDAYANALTYRALRNATALLADLNKQDLANICLEKAWQLQVAYEQTLLNPETGWVAAWKSRDGQLHDHASLWVNGPALAFGLLDPQKAKHALARLEALRRKVGLESARMGLPVNLLPIPDPDHMLPKISGAISQTFEMYTNGGFYMVATFYLRALSVHGFQRAARKMAGELAEGYVTGMFTGGNGTGREVLTWNGIPCGYEGTLIISPGALYAIAVEFGILKPAEPEWWPVSLREDCG